MILKSAKIGLSCDIKSFIPNSVDKKFKIFVFNISPFFLPVILFFELKITIFYEKKKEKKKYLTNWLNYLWNWNCGIERKN